MADPPPAPALEPPPPDQGEPALLRVAHIGTIAALINQHAGARGRAQLFKSCKSGSDLVLTKANHATVLLNVTSEAARKWTRQLGGVRRSLQKRNAPLKTCLKFHVSPSIPEQTAQGLLYSAPAQLRGAEASVYALHLTQTGDKQCVSSEVATVFLRKAASTFPGLKTVHLDPCPSAMPPPHALKHLSTLKFVVPATLAGNQDPSQDLVPAEFITSLLPYATQLTALEAHRQVSRGQDLYALRQPWNGLFTSTTKLTRFVTSSKLDVNLLGAEFVTQPCSWHDDIHGICAATLGTGAHSKTATFGVIRWHA